MTNRSNSFWRKRQTINGLKRKEVEIALKRYVAACERDVQAFIDTPTPETLEAAKAALDTFMNLHARWVAPYLPTHEEDADHHIGSKLYEVSSTSRDYAAAALHTFLRVPLDTTKAKTVAALELCFEDSSRERSKKPFP